MTYHTHKLWLKKISPFLMNLNAGSELLLLSARWSKSRLKWRGFLYWIQISQRLIVLFRESSGKAGCGIHLVVIYSRVGCILAKIFMHCVTSTSFVLCLLCRDDICSAQFAHPQQNTTVYVGDLIQVSWYYICLAHLQNGLIEMIYLVSTYISCSIIKKYY